MTRNDDTEKHEDSAEDDPTTKTDQAPDDDSQFVPLPESADHRPDGDWITAVDGIDGLDNRDAPVALGADGATVAVGRDGMLTVYCIEDPDCYAREEWSSHCHGRITAIEPLIRDRFVIVVSDEDDSGVWIAADGKSRWLLELPVPPRSVAAGGSRVFIATPEDGIDPPRLLVVDASDGDVERTVKLAGGPVSITASPSGRHVTIANRRTKQVRTVRAEAECNGAERGTDGDRCQRGVDGQPDDDGTVVNVDPDGSARKDHGTSTKRPGGRNRNGTSQRETGDPSDGERREPEQRDREPECRATLDWRIDRLRAAGSFLVATDKHTRRIAIIDKTDMTVLTEVGTAEDGRTIATNQRATRLLSYDHHRDRWERFDIERLLKTLPPRVVGIPDIFDGGSGGEPAIFHGQPQRMSIERVLTNDRMRILAVPMIEPSQTWNDSDISKFATFMDREAWEPVREYYDEVSFGTLDMQVEMLGDHVGSGTPIQLPRSFGGYFYPDFSPGGLRIEHTFSSLPADVDLDGTESARIRVSPRQRSEDTLSIPFCALGGTEQYDTFPVEISFDGSESLDLKVTDKSGSEQTISVSFDARTFTFTTGNVDSVLGDLETYLNDRIGEAEGSTDLVAPVECYRLKRSGADFGDIAVNLSVAASSGSGKGRIEVTGQSGLGKLGLDDPDLGSFTFDPSSGASALEEYLERALDIAQSEAGYGPGNRVLGSASVNLDGSTLQLTVKIDLSTNDGGGGAEIALDSQSGLSVLSVGSASPVPGSESNPDNQNTMKEIRPLANHVYTELVSRLSASEASDLPNYDAILLCYVGEPDGSVPSSERWDVTSPSSDLGRLRMYRRGVTATNANDSTDQWSGSWIGTILDADPDNATTIHEIAHVLDLSDIYHESGFRDDLRYMNRWAMMANHWGKPHFCGYMKLEEGWIPDGPEPRDDNDVRLRRVPKPVPDGPTTIEALLVPVEHWDSGMKAAVRSEFGGSVPIVQVLKINLGGDGVQYGLVEARQEGEAFSQDLPTEPAILVTNAIEHDDDTRYAKRGKYRRKLHLLNQGSDLTDPGDTFDLAAAPELSAKGVTAEIVDRRSVARTYGDVSVFHVKIEREQADYIDLAFTETTPNWRSPDVWVDWVGNNSSDDRDDHKVYSVGSPNDQGEQVRYPSSGTEPHWIVGRVWNDGTIRAEDVKLNYYICDPPGSGDSGNFNLHRTEIISEVPPGDHVTIPTPWNVDRSTNAHSCLRIEIADWTLPEDPDDAVALATDDLWLSNNWAQQNVNEFIPLSGSPYEPVEFQYSVNNDGISPERVRIEPNGLPEGMKLTVTPGVRVIEPGETAIFRCKLELDHTVIDAGCEGDREFRLAAWRETPHTQERWGAVKYVVRPREQSETNLEGNWREGSVHLYGSVTPPAAGERVLIRLDFAHGPTRWHDAKIKSGGTFNTEVDITEEEMRSKYVEVFARYEGNKDLGPSESDVLKLYQHHVR